MIIKNYRVDNSKDIFVHETQRISLKFCPSLDIETITASAVDINELKHIIIYSNYQGYDIVREVQLVQCETTGGIFGSSLKATLHILHMIKMRKEQNHR